MPSQREDASADEGVPIVLSSESLVPLAIYQRWLQECLHVALPDRHALGCKNQVSWGDVGRRVGRGKGRIDDGLCGNARGASRIANLPDRFRSGIVLGIKTKNRGLDFSCGIGERA